MKKNLNNVELCREVKWEYDEEKTRYITAINKRIETPAGIFENCIEIVDVIKGPNFTGYIKQYLAPNIGEVLTLMSVDSMDFDIVSYELIEYEIINNTEVSSEDNIEKNYYNDQNKHENNLDNESIEVINNNEMIIVKDNEFNFSLNVPAHWSDKFIISKQNMSEYNINLGNTYYKSLDFLYSPPNLDYQYMFSLVVYYSDMLEGVVDEQANSIRESAIIINDEFYVQCFTVPEPPSEEIANNEELLSEMSRMVNEDLPKILDSMKFIEN